MADAPGRKRRDSGRAPRLTVAAEAPLPTPHTLKNGAPAHILTAADRAKALETRRRRHEERKLTLEEKAWKKLDELLDALDATEPESQDKLLRTIREALDRKEGKPVQRVEAKVAALPLDIRDWSDEQLAAEYAKALERGLVDELPPAA